MISLNFNPLTLRRLQRFRKIRRGYYSFIAICILVVVSIFAPFLANSRPLIIITHQGDVYFPALYYAFNETIIPGSDVGQDYDYEAEYRTIQGAWSEMAEPPGWMLLPPIPYNPYENTVEAGTFPLAQPPDIAKMRLLGTDSLGRDVFVRLFYGFRVALIASLFYVVITYLVGILLGCSMGFIGGLYDLTLQRFIEILTNIPFLYFVIIIASIITPDVYKLVALLCIFSWISITYPLRAMVYKEKARDYVAAARVIGARPGRIIFSHILPNMISVVVTYIPFSVTTVITSLTALDYLGFGLPPPTPSWGHLLKEGTEYLNYPWIVASAFGALVITLTLVTFVGEAIREAFDPRKFTYYR